MNKIWHELNMGYWSMEVWADGVMAWILMRAVAGRTQPMPDKGKRWAVRIVAAAMTASVVYNNAIYPAVLYSFAMTVFLALVAAAAGRFLYRQSVRVSFLRAYLFLLLWYMTDFFLQYLIYLFRYGLEDRFLFVQVGDHRGAYLFAFGFCGLWLSHPIVEGIRRLSGWLMRKKGLDFITIVVLGGLSLYFQVIYAHSIRAGLIQAWLALILALLLCGAAALVRRLRDSRKEILRLQVKMLESNYQGLLKSYQEKSILIHDMRKHLGLIRQWAVDKDAGRIISYIDQMSGEAGDGGNRVRSNQPVFDLILNSKEQEAGEKGILFQVECDSCEGLQVKDSDLCSLLMNLLDNAIEANEKIADAGERWIRMKCRRRGRLLSVSITNPAVGLPGGTAGGLPTTKEDPIFHGYGLLSVRKVLEQYGGHMEHEVRDGKFCISFFLEAFEEMGEA